MSDDPDFAVDVWAKLIRAVAERNRPTQALLLNATVQELHNGTLVLSMPTEYVVKQLSRTRRIKIVQDALRAVLGSEWQVRVVDSEPHNCLTEEPR